MDYQAPTRGTARLQRHKLFANEGEGGLWTTKTGEQIVIRGNENLENIQVSV